MNLFRLTLKNVKNIFLLNFGLLIYVKIGMASNPDLSA